MSVAKPALVVVDARHRADPVPRVADRGRRCRARRRQRPTRPLDETASVFTTTPAPRPGARSEGRPDANGWLPTGSVRALGNNAHTYTDVNDNNAANPCEEVHPSGQRLLRLHRRCGSCTSAASRAPSSCAPGGPTMPVLVARSTGRRRAPRTSTSSTSTTTTSPRRRSASPRRPGNFQQVNHSGKGLGGDPVQDQPLDGANTAAGLPDPNHIDNANFATPPDGSRRRMQMYLFHQPGTSYPGQDPFIASVRLRRGGHRLPRVHPRLCPPPDRRLQQRPRRWTASRVARWARRGRTGTPATTSSTRGWSRTPAARRGRGRRATCCRASTIRSEPTDCPVGAPASDLPGHAGSGSRRLHLRRLRQDHSRGAGGPRRR